MSFDRVWSIAFVDGEPKVLFVGRESGAVQKYSAKTNELLLSFDQGHTAAVTGISAPSAEEITTCSMDTTLRQWATGAEVEGRRDLKTIPCDLAVRCLMPFGDAGFLCGTNDGPIVKIDGGKTAGRWNGHTDAVTALIQAEVFILSAGYDQTIRGWDGNTGTQVLSFVGHTNQVKSLALSASVLFSVARDDTMLLWNVPTELSAAPGADEGKAEGDAGDAPPQPTGTPGPGDDASSNAAAPTSSTPSAQIVQPIAVMELPSTPSAIAIGGNQAFVGCTDHSVACINIKHLQKSMQQYAADNESAFEAARRKLEQIRAVKARNAKRAMKRTVKEFKRGLQDAAAAEQAKQKAGTPAEGEEAAAEEDPDAEPEPPTLTPEQEQELASYTEAQTAELAKQIEELAAQKDKKSDGFAPLKNQRYVHARDRFISSPFCYVAARCPDSVVALSVDGMTVHCGAGDNVQIVETRAGVLAL